MKFEIKKVKEDRRKRITPVTAPVVEAPSADLQDQQRAILLQALAAVASSHASYLPQTASPESIVKTEETWTIILSNGILYPSQKLLCFIKIHFDWSPNQKKIKNALKRKLPQCLVGA